MQGHPRGAWPLAFSGVLLAGLIGLIGLIGLAGLAPAAETADGPAAERRPVKVRVREAFRDGPPVDWEIVSLPTRPGVTQRLLIGRPRQETRVAVILFPGGRGARSFREKGEGFRLGNNFLVRSAPLFAREGLVAAIADAPSDRAFGMSDGFRTGTDHLRDIRAAADFLSRDGASRIFLIGTSRGTLSVGYLATVMKHPRVRGFVLTSSMDDLSTLPLDQVNRPVLFVHHADDGCHVTTYISAQSNYARLTQSPRKHFITVSGGDTPISRACGALSEHGYLGMERKIVRAIATWVKGGTTPASVEP